MSESSKQWDFSDGKIVASDEQKGRILSELNQAATIYNNQVIDRTYLFVCEKTAFQAVFARKSFQHLTGIWTDKTGRNDFWRAARGGTLQKYQIQFTPHHDPDLVEDKLDVIIHLPDILSSGGLYFENLSMETTLFAGGIEQNQDCICFKLRQENSNPGDKIPVLVGASVRKDSLEKHIAKDSKPKQIDFVFVQDNHEKGKYHTRLYKREGSSIKEAPENAIKLLDKRFKKELFYEEDLKTPNGIVADQLVDFWKRAAPVILPYSENNRINNFYEIYNKFQLDAYAGQRKALHAYVNPRNRAYVDPELLPEANKLLSEVNALERRK